ncbi:hypothetical protein GGH19_002754 [Coemansia sp. RSA 1807]|nr:hypothetical protein LPJ54_001914 [Coemansia sp. RSA 1824]KAJ2136386.1 hypothetical protein GGH17_001984 [Coemansia sp. RSA 788]KAJ2142809.1 hypothetical protein IW142_004081 [Coemansia sp. RSA 564]KAJ2162939.1 hypothetical protein GGH15_004616 [Coemansia sp. RSA 562]KAJ2183804.1 hypothetical protein EV181_004702 [Coemansia sp. RSA 532]KAJ2192428.1 hypothetical protein IW144_004887 [Coemansia sp. RSA 522]KAJ2195212.1 hypothetical protein GGH18_001984 [Coemansia sp. RSA 530]KAJ2202549.1 hy
MAGPPSAATTALTALTLTLGELEAQQHELLARLRHIHESLCSNSPNDELLTTFTHYTNQAKYIRRRMTLVRGRVGDLKRRADRLKAHWAEQSQQMAEWMHEERAREVPEAVVSASLPEPSFMERASGLESGQAFQSPLRISNSMGGRTDTEDGLGSSAPSRPDTPQSTAHGRALSTATTLDSPSAAPVSIATVKRKGKRRVRVPTIE